MADFALTADAVIPSAQANIMRGFAGVLITAGQVVYLDPATNTFLLAKANVAAPVNIVKGIALERAGVGEAVNVVLSDPALNIGATTPITAGKTLILSGTNAGGIAPDADGVTGWFKTILGVTTAPNIVNFNPLPSGVAMP
jgi:hypothetical protein